MKKITNSLTKLALVVLLLLGIGSCQKPYEVDLPLAVSRAEFTLPNSEGMVSFWVYSQKPWTASFEQPIQWATLSRTSGGNQTQVNVNYTQNDDLSRGITIIIRSGELTRTVYISQKAGFSGDVAYNLEHQAVNVTKDAISVAIAADNDVPESNFQMGRSDVNYVTEGEEWINNIVIGKEGLTFDVKENTTNELRQAMVTITFPVAEWDTPITAMVAVSQSGSSASLGQIAESIAADPNGITPLSVSLSPNFSPQLYDLRVIHTIDYGEGDTQNWLRNCAIDNANFKFTAEPKPNPYPTRTATARFDLVDASNNVLDSRTLTITQQMSDMGSVGGGDNSGEEPKDPEEDF